MYSGKSRLCSSYAWDTALKFIGEEYAVNSTGGNYSENGGVKTTGYHSVKNIYDMGGNVWEWTSEDSTLDGYTCVYRGGLYDIYGISNSPAAGRAYNSTVICGDNIGFRCTLYM